MGGCGSTEVGKDAGENSSRRRSVLASCRILSILFAQHAVCSLQSESQSPVSISVTTASCPQAHATRPSSQSQPHDNAMVPALEAHPSCIHACITSHLSHPLLISPDSHSKRPSRTHPSAPTGSDCHHLRLWIAQTRTAHTPGSRPCSGLSRRLCRR